MQNRLTHALALSATLLCVAALTAQEDAAIRRGRMFTRLLFEGRTDSLHAMMTERFSAAIGGAPAVEQLSSQLVPLGESTVVVKEETVAIGSIRYYDRIARFEAVKDRTITISWSWRRDGRLVGGLVQPTPAPAASTHEKDRTKTELRLPFNGEWTVAWGGRAPHRNYHVVQPDQRFAYDLLIVRDSSTHTGDGSRNEDYHCFGAPVLAPAAGRIIAAVDTLPDNEPGEILREAPAGNHVVIDHANGEFTVLAHMQHGSVAVSHGDAVQAGDTVGQCGNSGNSSEPHLHYHLQDRATLGPEAAGLPAQFTNYLADGTFVERGEPVRGQRIGPAGGP